MKIFGIGLSKTGTTSLARALEVLGYKVKDCLQFDSYKRGDLSSIDSNILLSNDAFTDTPIPSFYRELDKEFPGSKFILTVRSMDAWLASCKKQFNQKHADKQTDAVRQLFTDIYGTAQFDADKFRAGYEKFTEQVMDYFKDRPEDLLVINVADGDGWGKLCAFLDKPVPEMPFPKSNVTQIAWLNPAELAGAVRLASAGLRGLGDVDNTVSGGLFSKLRLWWRQNKLTTSKQKTLALITKHLKSLNAGIPVISETHSAIPLGERARWNHFWLIDVGFEAEAAGVPGKGAGPVISVALIQDGAPYLGVVYSPVEDLTYFSALNKTAYRVLGDAKPLKISPVTPNGFAPPELPQSSQDVIDVGRTSTSTTASFAWRVCVDAEAGECIDASFVNSKEWQTAAANAVLRGIGFQLVDSESGQQLSYNKDEWLNKPLFIVHS